MCTLGSPDIHPDTVQICDVTGTYHVIQRKELIKTAQGCIAEQFNRGEAMTGPKKSADYFQVLLGSYEHETFYVLWLDSQHQVLKAQELFRGTVDSASLSTRSHQRRACLQRSSRNLRPQPPKRCKRTLTGRCTDHKAPTRSASACGYSPAGPPSGWLKRNVNGRTGADLMISASEIESKFGKYPYKTIVYCRLDNFPLFSSGLMTVCNFHVTCL